MRKRLIAYLMIFTSIVLVMSACKKEKGCMDLDAENLDLDAEKDDGSCQYRYASSIDVNSFPSTDGNGNAWDILGDGPDIYVRFSKASSMNWDYRSNTADNTYAPSSLVILSGIQFTNSDWHFQLMDADDTSADDLIASGTFNPLTDGSNGSITIDANGTSVTFKYTVDY